MKPLLINSKWVEAPEILTVSNPYNGEPVARVFLGNAQILDQAIAAAESAFQMTRKMAPYERAEVLRKIVHGIKGRAWEFAEIIMKESGKPIRFAQAEVQRALDTFAAAAEEARHLQGGLVDMEAFSSGAGHFGVMRRFPLGVISAISPFNFPLNLVAHKVAPCIATGNTMVLKPSPKTPLTALLLGEVLLEAGVPAGQVNIVTCRNEEAMALVSDERVKMVSFTGSPEVGWRLKELCGRKKIALELGGNAAVVVHADADMEQAVPLIAMGAFAMAGQSCISVQRVIVHESVYGRFVALFLRAREATHQNRRPQRAGDGCGSFDRCRGHGTCERLSQKRSGIGREALGRRQGRRRLHGGDSG